jgi:hypothetical protein
MTAEMIRQLPDGRALVIRGGLSPVIARLPMAWKDREYKRARRTGRAAVVLPAVATVDLPAVPDLAVTAARLRPDVPGGEAEDEPAAPVEVTRTWPRNGSQQQWPWQ